MAAGADRAYAGAMTAGIVRFIQQLAGMLQLFTDNPAQSFFQWLASLSHVLPQCAIDQRLVIAASSLINLAFKPVDNILVKPDSDSGLA